MAIIGIDLGTTNSLAAVWKENKCLLIPNSFANSCTRMLAILTPLLFLGALGGEALRDALVIIRGQRSLQGPVQFP